MRQLCALFAALTLLLVAGGQLPPSPSQLSHISGSSRKIRMYVKNFYLSLGLDGRVTGLPDDTSNQTVLQRSSVTLGKVKIQGVTTCMFLCMDICGIPYAAREFNEECVFNENIEENHYNTYSSAKYSNGRRTLYLGLNRRGGPRRVLTRAGSSLGRQATFAQVLTQPVPHPPRPPTTCPTTTARTPQIGRCRFRLRRPRRRKRKRCREEEGCPLARRRKTGLRRIRHRKHRTVSEAELEEADILLEEEEDEEVTMTLEEDMEEQLDSDSSEQ